MKSIPALLLGVALAGAVLSAPPCAAWALDPIAPHRLAEKKEKKDKKAKKNGSAPDEAKPDGSDAERQLERYVRDMQLALEGASPHSFLGFLDTARFEDYPRFEDQVERLLREDAVQVYFRTSFSAPPREGKAQMSVEADMELVRKDAVGQLQRRQQQVLMDWEYTRRGWKVINITPRDFFRPL